MDSVLSNLPQTWQCYDVTLSLYAAYWGGWGEGGGGGAGVALGLANLSKRCFVCVAILEGYLHLSPF